MQYEVMIKKHTYQFIEIQDHPEEISIRTYRQGIWYWLGHIKLFTTLSNCCVLVNCYSDYSLRHEDKQHIRDIAEWLNFEPSEVNEEYDGLYINMYTSPEKFFVIKTYLKMMGGD